MGKSSPSLTAVLNGPAAVGALVFTGPVAQALQQCTINGVEAEARSGRPPAGVLRGAPTDVTFYLKTDGAVAYLLLDAGKRIDDDYVVCTFDDGFASDDPPYHQLMTPDLTVNYEGVRLPTDGEIPSTPDLCVSVSVPQVEGLRKCADANYLQQGYPQSSISSNSFAVTQPSEQGLRDGTLLILGGVAGVLASLLAKGVWLLSKRLWS